tara:strand:- start:1005 stop:1694 length:690 start_codon:yes stop_codon:yes gene_type:complete
MDNPKIMYNPATKKMTAMDPKDDNLVNSIYNSPNPVKRVEKLVKETTPPSSIEEYNKQQQDKIKPYNHFDKSTYPSNYTPQQRARLIREAKQKQKLEDKKHSLFSDTIKDPDIKRIARRFVDQPRAVDTWKMIEKTMTPKERREFYKDKKEKPKDLYKDIPPGPDLEQLSKDINNYLRYRKEMAKPLPESSPRPQTYSVMSEDKGLGSMDRPNEITRNAFRQLRIFNDK